MISLLVAAFLFFWGVTWVASKYPGFGLVGGLIGLFVGAIMAFVLRSERPISSSQATRLMQFLSTKSTQETQALDNHEEQDKAEEEEK
jgi:hypothetical protein